MTIDVQKYTDAVKASTPGRFEGEHAMTAYYWEAIMDGDGEAVHYNLNGDGMVTNLFVVSDEERVAFAILGDVVAVWQDTAGFISSVELTADEADRVRSEPEADYRESPRG